jgi:hypothetical protein
VGDVLLVIIGAVAVGLFGWWAHRVVKEVERPTVCDYCHQDLDEADPPHDRIGCPVQDADVMFGPGL